jgi:hypothetical protein
VSSSRPGDVRCCHSVPRVAGGAAVMIMDHNWHTDAARLRRPPPAEAHRSAWGTGHATFRCRCGCLRADRCPRCSGRTHRGERSLDGRAPASSRRSSRPPFHGTTHAGADGPCTRTCRSASSWPDSSASFGRVVRCALAPEGGTQPRRSVVGARAVPGPERARDREDRH